MEDRAILFFSIIMIIICLYRIILSILLLSKKIYIIDEKYYISFFYYSLVGILILFTDWLIVGIILFAMLPVILFLYVAFFKNRKYWIINGYDITESSFINKIVETYPEYADSGERMKQFRIYRKKEEKKTKIEFSNIDYDKKENILKIIKQICKEKTDKANKNEIIFILIYSFMILVFTFFILVTLLT